MIKIKLNPLGIYKKVPKRKISGVELSYSALTTRDYIGRKVLINDWNQGYLYGTISSVDRIKFKLNTSNEEKEFFFNTLEELLIKVF